MSGQTPLPPKQRMRKWPFVLLFLVVLFAGAGYYIYSNYIAGDKWKPLLQQQLKELVLKSSDSLYHIEYSDFSLNVPSGDATLSNFKLVPDSEVYQKLVALKKAPDNLYTLSVKKLTIKNVGAKKAYEDKILNIDDIAIDNPSLTVVNKRYDFNDHVKVGKPQTPYQIIKKVFKQLHIGSISLKDISVNYINKNEATAKQTSLKHMDIHISDVLIDSLSALDTSRFYYTRDINITVHDYKINTPDNLYSVSLDRISFSTEQRKIVLDKVAFTPRYNRDEFYKRTHDPGDIFTLKFKKIDINDIDLQGFLRDKKLYANTLSLANASVNIYSNDAYGGKKSSKIGKDPQQALQKVALDLRLKRLNIENTDIIYSETDATTLATGIISFKNTSGYILNVTNDAGVKRVNPYMVAHINTHFMDAAPLQVNFKFDLNAKNGAFNYSGTLGKFDGRILDKLVKPLAMVHVKSADIQRLTFNVDASNYHGKGHLEFYYNNLKIELLKKVNGKTELQQQGFLSKVANAVIVNDNPDKSGTFRPGPIDLPRGHTTSFFSFLYQALLDGLKPSVGFSKKTENTVNNIATKVSTLVDKFKQYKEERKQKRAERREERRAKKDAAGKNN